MNQAQLTSENPVTAVSDAGFEESVLRPQRPAQGTHWDAESYPVTFEDYPLDGRPALVFFWDGQKIHRITGAQPQEEMARIIDNSL